MLASLPDEFRSLVYAIQERGRRAGKVPFIVWTTYPIPLPAADSAIDKSICPDSGSLSRAQIDYLSSLSQTLARTTIDAVGGLPGVAIAELGTVLAGHELCSSDPWVFGPSILAGTPTSLAPFHPTEVGQRAIAQVVRAAIPDLALQR